MNLTEKFLKLHEAGLKYLDIADILEISSGRVSQLGTGLGLTPNHPFLEQKFLNLYLQGLNDEEISKHIGVSGSAASSFRRSLGLISKKSTYIELTDEQEQIVLGTVLGDGHLYNYKDTAMLKFDHSEKQKDYLFYKYEKLKNLCKIEPYFLSQKHNVTGKIYTKYSCRTKSLISLKKYRNLFYKPTKIITKEVADMLQPLAIAIYYFDDGTFDGNHLFAIFSFNEESVNNFKNALLRFGIHSNTQRKGNIIYIPAKSRIDFNELIKPYCIDNMKYKLLSL